MPELVYLSLGSNLGDREANLASAISALGTYHEIKNIRTASFYESDPRYNEDQPKFLNTVMECETEFSPFELLDAVGHVEQLLGRPAKREKNMPRTIDIDILCFGDRFIETRELTLPHPGIPNRKFVLVPFYELVPDFVVKVWKKSVHELLEVCPDTSRLTKHVMEKRA